MDLKLRIGNEDKTSKGGNGLGIYYLRDINKDTFGEGLFGYSKTYDGLGVFMNSILQTRDKENQKNYIQAFTNDGTK